MSKILMDSNVYGELKALCRKLQAKDGEAEKTADGLHSVRIMCKCMEEDMEIIAGTAEEVDCAIYDGDLPTAVRELGVLADHLREMAQDVETLTGHLRYTAASLCDATEPDGFAPTCTPEEMEQIIEQGFDDECVMSVGYRGGEYALFFGEGEEENGPHIFAVGREEDEEIVRAYVESFLDMEDDVEWS